MSLKDIDIGPLTDPEETSAPAPPAPAPTPIVTLAPFKSLIAAPPKFNEDKDKFENFKQGMLLYLEGNKDVLKTDKDRILVVLSYLDSGYAGIWAMAFLEESIAKVPIGRWDDFLYQLSDAFEKTTKAQDAYTELDHLYQGTKTAKEYWLHFEALCIKAEFDKVNDYKTLFRFIMTHMNKPLIDKCFGSKNVPTTVAEWKKKTINYDRGWRQCKEIFESAKRMGSGPSQYTPRPTNE
jgi:hypothetical protein